MWGDFIGGNMVVTQHRTNLLGERDGGCMVDYAGCMVDHAHGRTGNEGGRSCISTLRSS